MNFISAVNVLIDLELPLSPEYTGFRRGAVYTSGVIGRELPTNLIINE